GGEGRLNAGVREGNGGGKSAGVVTDGPAPMGGSTGPRSGPLARLVRAVGERHGWERKVLSRPGSASRQAASRCVGRVAGGSKPASAVGPRGASSERFSLNQA